MKKLLVLALVLVASTMVSAALIVSGDGTDGGTYGFAATEGSMVMAYDVEIKAVGGTFDFTNLDLSGSAGFGIAGATVGAPTDVLYRATASSIALFGQQPQTGQLIDGIVFTLDAGVTEGYVQVWAPNAGTEVDGSLLETGMIAQVLVVPEPITVALLGLGGLFIRRRK